MSVQKKLVFQIVQDSCDHPTAEDVYQIARESLPKISVATVYRNLSLLTEVAKIKRIEVFGSADRYEKITHDHDHLLCDSCGKLADIDCIRCLVPPCHSDVEIRRFDVIARGLCSSCSR